MLKGRLHLKKGKIDGEKYYDVHRDNWECNGTFVIVKDNKNHVLFWIPMHNVVIIEKI